VWFYLVYARLAPGLVKELETKNPKDDRGNRKARHHQWLTEDIGHPALAQHLYATIGLMRIAESWGHLLKLMNKAYPKKESLEDLPLFNDDPS
jgi:hypothetical protein